jgi:Na+/H+-dicarboxylate symporter
MMRQVSAVLCVSIAVVFSIAAAHKAVNLRAFGDVLHSLFGGRAVPVVLATFVCGAEAISGLWLVPQGGSRAAVVVAVSGVAFAAAAGVALLRRVDLECGCFGATARARLGRRQLILLPPMLAASWVIYHAPPAATPVDRMLANLLLATIILSIIVWQRTKGATAARRATDPRRRYSRLLEVK